MSDYGSDIRSVVSLDWLGDYVGPVEMVVLCVVVEDSYVYLSAYGSG